MGSGSIRLCRVAGIRLEIHFTFLLLWLAFAFIGAWGAAASGGWLNAVLSVLWLSGFLVAIFVCVVLHELGHCLAGRYYGIGVSRILILPVGGMAQFERIPRDPWQEIVISIAGPLVNVALAIAIVTVTGWPTLPYGGYYDSQMLPLTTATFFHGLLVVNVVMAIFNLLPIFPMDGGRLLRAVLAMRLSYVQATSIAANLAKVLAVVGIIVAAYQFWILPVILFAIIYLGGDVEYRMVKRREKTHGLFVGDLMSKNFLSVGPEQPMGEALEIFMAYRPSEILVMQEGVPYGILTGRAMRRAQRRGWLNHPVRRHTVRKLSVLQAGWPLHPFVDMITHSRQRLYPVYSFGDLVGVLDTRNLETMIAWKRLQERSECDIHFRE